MVNILSVDFDWIMEPCINLYNAIAIDECPLYKQIPETENNILLPDYKKLFDLYGCLKNISTKINDPQKVLFRRHHLEIIDCINNQWKITEPYRLYNIDHHHDCGYNDTLEAEYAKSLASSNWVLFCKDLKSYTWIGNKNSDPNIIREVRQSLSFYQYTDDLKLINFTPFDYIFVCLSPGWIPKNIFPLFDMLELSITNKLTDITEV